MPLDEGKLVGSPRACKFCGAQIKFKITYDVKGVRKFLPANLDGGDHLCLKRTGAEPPRDRSGSVEGMLMTLAESVGVEFDGKTNQEIAKNVGKMLGKTPAEVIQQCEAMLKLEQMKNGNNSGNGVGESGKSSGGKSISDLVDQAVEEALGSEESLRGSEDSGREEGDRGGAESDSVEEGNDENRESSADSGGSDGGENETGDGEEGSGSRQAPEGNEGEVPQQRGEGKEEGREEAEEGRGESEAAGEEKAEGEGEGKEGEGKQGKQGKNAREQVKVDKEVLKRIAQKLKDQIKEETTHKEVKELKLPDGEQIDVTGEHYLFKEFVQLLVEGEKPFLVGPAGSGKTTAALNAAAVLGKVLGREDYRTYVKSFCMMSGKHELEGFIDANGVCQDTDFRIAFTEGHLYFMDEVDAANPNVLLVLNAAIENGIMSFPDGMLSRHEHFRIGVGANTVGLGADAQYSGRTQLDAAFRNRFYFLAWEYDEEMEMKWAGEDQKEWVKFVQAIRKGQQKMGNSAPRIVVSPRASIRGAKRLRMGTVPKTTAGFELLADALIWQGCSVDDKRKVLANSQIPPMGQRGR